MNIYQIHSLSCLYMYVYLYLNQRHLCWSHFAVGEDSFRLAFKMVKFPLHQEYCVSQRYLRECSSQAVKFCAPARQFETEITSFPQLFQIFFCNQPKANQRVFCTGERQISSDAVKTNRQKPNDFCLFIQFQFNFYHRQMKSAIFCNNLNVVSVRSKLRGKLGITKISEKKN